MNRDRIRCYKYREYDHFASNCPNSVMDEESDLYDSDNQSALEILVHYPHDDLRRASSGETIDILNL